MFPVFLVVAVEPPVLVPCRLFLLHLLMDDDNDTTLRKLDKAPPNLQKRQTNWRGVFYIIIEIPVSGMVIQLT